MARTDTPAPVPADGTAFWNGMMDCWFRSPNGVHDIRLPYVSEPPFGDSYHDLIIDGHRLPGYAWGAKFAFSSDSRYLALEWMAERWARKTMVVDLPAQRYRILIFFLSPEAWQGHVLTGTDWMHPDKISRTYDVVADQAPWQSYA